MCRVFDSLPAHQLPIWICVFASSDEAHFFATGEQKCGDPYAGGKVRPDGLSLWSYDSDGHISGAGEELILLIRIKPPGPLWCEIWMASRTRWVLDRGGALQAKSLQIRSAWG